MIYSCTIPLSMDCPLCKPKLSHGTKISCPKGVVLSVPSKELGEKVEKMELVSVRVKPTINTRNADIMSMKKFMDKETQTDGNPSTMRRLYPSLPSKGEIIDISSNDSDYLYL